MKWTIGMLAVAVLAVLLVGNVGCKPTTPGELTTPGNAATPEKVVPAKAGPPHIEAADAVAAGQYFALIGSCNNCHTPKWHESEGKLPTEEWLTGNPTGYHGDHGTTYATNLRLVVQEDSEDEWVSMFRKPDPERPPMPWLNYKTADEGDLRAAYRFIKSLGPKGAKEPEFVPAGKTPKTAYRRSTTVEPKKK